MSTNSLKEVYLTRVLFAHPCWKTNIKSYVFKVWEDDSEIITRGGNKAQALNKLKKLGFKNTRGYE